MNLDSILDKSRDALEICLRERAYGVTGKAELIRDVMSLANLPGDEPRYIVVGVRDEAGVIAPTGLDERSLSEVELYADWIRQYLEPEPPLRVDCHSFQGKLVVVVAIEQPDNPPYMIATDLSESLRAGACWIREPGLYRAARRRDFDRMYGTRMPVGDPADPRPAPAARAVQLGFNNDPEAVQLVTRVPDLEACPSVVAARRLQDQIKVVKAAGERNVTDSSVARLVHAQQYGAELPYDERGVNTLIENYNAVSEEYREADEYFYNETNALKLSFCIRNASEHMLEKVTVVLTLPVVDEFRVVERLWPAPGSQQSHHESDMFGYPAVKYYKGAAQVRQDIEQLPPGASQPLFESALRVALKPAIAGKKIAVRYALHARGLSEPEEGVLKLVLRK